MPLRIVGKSVPKIDGLEKAHGKAIYINDMQLPGMLHGKILRSTYPHARILRIDVSEAESLDGVEAVITAKDLPGGLMGPFIKDEPVLAIEKVRYMGEPVAAVAALDLETAEAALGLIEVEYEELPALFDPEEAMRPDAPLIHDDVSQYVTVFDPIQGGNVCSETTFVQGDLEKGFAEADVIVEETFTTQMHHQAYIEPSGAMARVAPNGRIEVWACVQGVSVAQARIAEALHIPMNRIRVVSPRVGGGFGGKIEPHVQPIAVALAMKAERPVKVLLTREEEFSATRPRHPTKITCKLGVTRDGTIVAQQITSIFDSGAYADDGPGVAGFGSLMARGPYRVPNFELKGTCVYTNKVKTGAFRGFGNPQTTFARESTMDIAAEKIGMDPLEFRKRNAMNSGDLSVGGQVVESVGIQECLDRAAEAAAWGKPKGSALRGRGIASVNHISGLLTVSSIVTVNEDGTISLHVGIMDVGQGVDTTLTQICAEELGVEMEDVFVLSADTDTAPYSWATTASRLTYTAGNSVRRAAREAKEKILALASGQLHVRTEELHIEQGRVYSKTHPDRSLTLKDVGAISCWVTGGAIVGHSSFMVEDPAMDRSGFKGFPFGTMTAYIYAGQAVEVEVDTQTGQVKVLHVAAAHDVGKAINPRNVEGQIEGGVVQGLGYALTEETLFDAGRVVNPSLADYRIFAAADVPPITPIIVEAHDDTGPYGAKGVGEPVLCGIAPAIANAIYDAVGVRITDLPFTPEKILTALDNKGT